MITTGVDAEGTSVITVDGELDLSNTPALDRTVQLVLGENPPERLIFDLAGLRFMDSTGINSLVVATRGGTAVEIRDPMPAIRRLIEVTGLLSILTIVPAAA